MQRKSTGGRRFYVLARVRGIVATAPLANLAHVATLATVATVATLASGALVPANAAKLAVMATEGTDLALAARDDGIVIDVAARLWRLPATGGEAKPLTPAGEHARRPALSPDGSRLAYQALRDGFLHIVVADADGKGAEQLTRGASHHLAPAWSPDGRKLVFASDRGGDFGIWQLELDGGALTQLTFDQGDELDPAWDPAGRSFAYVHELAGRSSLELRVPFKPPQTLVGKQRRLRGPSWRPDGSVLSFTAADAADGQRPRLKMVILSDPPVVKPLSRTEAAGDGPARWLDRNRLVYAADGGLRLREFGASTNTPVPFAAKLELAARIQREPRRPAAAEKTAADATVRGIAGLAVLPDRHLIVAALGDLWELDATGALVRQLTNDAFLEREPAVSRDGRILAFSSDRDGRPQIWTLTLATGQLRQLTSEPGFAARPAWSASGDRVVYVAGTETSDRATLLKVVAVDTRQTQELAAGLLEPATPAWAPGDAQIGFVARDPAGARLTLHPLEGGTARKLTLPNEVADFGRNEAQWSGDGKSLLIASASGVRALAMLDNGLVGAQSRTLVEGPARLARWVPGEDAVILVDAGGLARSSAGATPTRIALPLTRTTAAPAGRTIIRGARIFEGTGERYLFGQDVLLVDGRIAAVKPSGQIAAEPGNLLIDATGKTVVPGLIDTSIALPDAASERLGRTLLAYGITTVQITVAPGAGASELAEAWAAHAAGPQLLVATAWCGGPLAAAAGATPPLGAIRLCPSQLAGEPGPLAGRDRALWAPTWLGALAGRADVVAALPVAGPAEAALTGTGPLYQESIDVLLRSGAVLVPGLARRGMPLLADEPGGLLVSSQYVTLQTEAARDLQMRAWRGEPPSERAARRGALREAERLVGRLSAGGGRFAASSGSPETPYGLGLHAELKFFAEAGLGRAAVLRMATAEAAAVLGLESEIGQIAAGRRADLLIIDGDPLADLNDLLKIDSVVVAGRVRPLSMLLR